MTNEELQHEVIQFNKHSAMLGMTNQEVMTFHIASLNMLTFGQEEEFRRQVTLEICRRLLRGLTVVDAVEKLLKALEKSND